MESSESEQEILDVDLNEEKQLSVSSTVPYFIGKNNIKWKKHSERPNVRTRSHNLVMHLPGPKASTKNFEEPIDIWKYFFNDTMLTTIVENTNKHINFELTQHCQT